MNRPALHRLFSACDVNKSGRIELEDFKFVCKQLNVLNTDIRFFFNKFDVNEEGHIDFSDFSARFNEVSPALDLGPFCKPAQTQRNAWEQFEETFDGDFSYLGRLRDQLAELYLQIHSSTEGTLMQPYETLVRALVSESKDHVFQKHRLESSLRRAEELAARQLTELKEELQQQLDHREKLEEEQQHLEAISVQRRHDREVTELQAVVERLMKENAKLKSSLVRAQTDTSRMKETLDHLRCERTDHRETENLKTMSREYLSQSRSWEPNRKPNETLDVQQSSAEDVGLSDRASKIRPRRLEEVSPVGPLCPGSTAAAKLKRLPAFPTEQAHTDACEDDGSDPVYKLVLAGDAGSGKSSFLLRLSTHEFRRDAQSTVGVDCQTKRMLVDGEKTTLQIWDTAGQERFRSITRSYFRDAHGILLLYDITREDTFLNIGQWMNLIQEATEGPVPMCVIGNKADLRSDLPEGSCVTMARGERLATAYNALFCETSAKEGTNVVEAVLHLAREVTNNPWLRQTSGSQVLQSHTDEKRSTISCCGM